MAEAPGTEEPSARSSPAAASAQRCLALRRVAIDTYRENVAYLHRQCEIYRAEGFQALNKVEICGDGAARIIAVLNVVDENGCQVIAIIVPVIATIASIRNAILVGIQGIVIAFTFV